ncbi:hypothetical protein OMD46_16585 [Pseudomonas sp. MDMC_285]|nr:hypothetical protein [Pseudomonas sp. MDMC_285]
MFDQLMPGDSALIIHAIGSPELIGQCCEVLDVLIDNQLDHYYAGRGFRGMADGSLSAFIDVNGRIEFFDCKRLMKLWGELAPAARREVAHA